MNNPCIRCGKQRIDGKSWKGKIGISSITYTLTICPDPGCQKIVDQGIADKKAAKLARENGKNYLSQPAS